MTRLLVSVRSAAEAEAALQGGASLIDVKEPAHGPLGMADPQVIADVIRVVSGRLPVSAALGEARDACDLPGAVAADLAFVKYGPAGCGGEHFGLLRSVFFRAQNAACRVVVAAYADWHRADAPSPEELCRLAVENRAGAFLVDTWGKDGSTLLDWLPLRELEILCRRCREAGVPVALAGSLGPAQMQEVTALRPDWMAVRGAACRGGRRQDTIDPARVRNLAELIAAV